MPNNSRVLYMGDLHTPYHHKDAPKFLQAVKDKYNPTRVISTGDELDNHNMSNWVTELEADNARTELAKGRKAIRKIASIFPVVECVESNHTSRIYRMGKQARILRELLPSYKELLDIREYNWSWEHDVTLTVAGRTIRAVHHAGANSFLNAQRSGISIIAGHMHTKQFIQFYKVNGNKNFAAQTGCLLDQSTVAFKYTADHIAEALLGCIMLLNGSPRIIEMNLTTKGRWNKKVN